MTYPSDVSTAAVADVYYSGCFTALARSDTVPLQRRTLSSSLLRGETEKYDMWIAGSGNYHCSCPFTRYQSIESKEPCKHVLCLAISYLQHKGFFNGKQTTQ